MLPNFKTDLKVFAKTFLQIMVILLVFSVLFLGLLSYITKDGFSVEVGPPPAPTETTIAEGYSLSP